MGPGARGASTLEPVAAWPGSGDARYALLERDGYTALEESAPTSRSIPHGGRALDIVFHRLAAPGSPPSIQTATSRPITTAPRPDILP